MSYIGNEPIVSATRTITEVTATAGQTVFTPNGGYTVGKLDVVINGAELSSSDFTATNGTTVTITTACSVGDTVKLVAWGTFTSSSSYSQTEIDNKIGAAQFAFKNRIINGAMAVAQRGTSFTLTSGATAYTLDRWYANTTGGAGVVAQTGSVGANNLQITGAAGVSSCFFGQKIESNNIADLVGQTVTYSITLSSSTLTTINWYARYPNAQDNYAGVTNISNGTLTLTSTPTQYTFNIVLPAGAANGLEIFFLTGAFTSGTLVATKAQLEKGSVATSFDYRPYGTELALCQRYYEKSYNTDVVPGTATNIGAIISFTQLNNNFVTGGGIFGKFGVTKRANPTVTAYSSDGTSGQMRNDNNGTNTAATVDLIGMNGFRVYSGWTAQAAVNLVCQYTASAEL